MSYNDVWSFGISTNTLMYLISRMMYYKDVPTYQWILIIGCVSFRRKYTMGISTSPLISANVFLGFLRRKKKKIVYNQNFFENLH